MPTPKQQAKEAITNERHSEDRYSVESLRANMSTGGGEPIPKGKTRTTEKRVLQPRDPDTGQFEFNSSAMYGRKFPDRSKADHMPIAGRGWLLNEGIKKGDKVNIDGKVWIAIESIDRKELVEYFKKYNEKAGEYSGGNAGEVRRKLSSNFIRKHGRMSKEEKAGIEEGKRILGKVDMSALSETSIKEMKEKFADAYMVVEGGNSAPYAKDVEKPAEKPLDKGMGKGGAGGAGGAGPAKPAEAKPAEEKPAEKPEEKPEEPKPEEKKSIWSEESFTEMESDMEGFYNKNKDAIDSAVDAFNKKNGVKWSAAKYLKAKLNKWKKKGGK